MTAIDTTLRFRPAAPVAAAPRTSWPWLTTIMIFTAFFLGAHDLQASRHWLKPQKGELNSLAEQESSGRASRQVGFLLLGGVGLILLLRPGSAHSTSPNLLILFPLMALLAWALFSAIWSADMAITLKRQIILVCTLLAAAGLIKQYTLPQLGEIVLVQSLAIVLLGVVVESVLHPARGAAAEEYRFAGTLHPNHMGIHASLLLMSSLFLAHHRAQRRFLLISIVAVVALIMTKSRTALFSAILGSVVFAVLAYPPRKRIVIILLILLASAIGFALVVTDTFSNISQTVLMNRASSDPTTLTGRTMIWQFAYDRVRGDSGRLLAGFGYGGFWTRETAQALSQRAHFALSEGHNAYLDVMLQLGLVGLAFYLCCLLEALWAWVSTAWRFASASAALAAGVLCFAINHHIAESALTAPSFPTLVVWCIIGSAALYRDAGPNWKGNS